MQIRKIIIDGFGCFADKRITGLKAGINVIYGENESGKTTLLEFIRRILFGFPTRKESKNLYPALYGGAYGGKLICELADGKPLIIARTEGPKGGKLTIRENSAEEWVDPKILGKFLGHATPTLYENVYGFTIDELQDVASLKKDEVHNRIYGAGWGNLPLTNIQKEFDDHCGDLFKPTGSKQKIRELHKEIKNLQSQISEVQTGLKRYDELEQTLGKLKEEKDQVETQIRKEEKWKGILEKQLDFYGDYVELVGVEEELAGLEVIGDEFPENGLSSFETLRGEVKKIEDRLSEETGEYEIISRRLENIPLNEELLNCQAEVASLQQSTRQIEEALRDQISAREKKVQVDKQIQEELERISGDWDEETVSRFTLAAVEEDRMQSLRQEIDLAREHVQSARDKRDMYLEERAKEQAKRFQAPAGMQWASAGFVVLGIGGFLYGWAVQNLALEIFAGVIFFLGLLFSFLVVKGRGKKDKVDHAEAAYTEKLLQAEKKLETGCNEWRGWLRSKNLNEGLRPEAIDKVLRNIQEVQGLIREKKGLEQRLELMRRTVANAQKTIDRIRPSIDHLPLSPDVVANINMIQHCFEEARKNAEEKAHLRNLAANHQNKREQLENLLKGKKIAITEFLQAAGAVDENDFLNKSETLLRRKKLEDKKNQKREIIQKGVGLGESYDSFIASMKTVDPQELERKLDEVSSSLKKIEADRNQLSEGIGGTDREIQQLSSNEDLLKLQCDLEIEKQRLNDVARQWAAAKIALLLLEQAKNKYEKERQPAVIVSAGNMFASITCGKYSGISKPHEKEVVALLNGLGDSKTVEEMSRGTREQLYLAMRLGLIEEYEKRAEPLPLIMDDVLVNFDEVRGSEFMQILRGFAQARQVLLLSCHRHTLKVCIEMDAHQVVF